MRRKFNRAAFVRSFFVVLIFILLAILGNIFLKKNCESGFEKKSANNAVSVHFIDVGQGDCTLISDRARTVLIDCGEVDKGAKVARYLKKLGINKVDYFISTHPHTDHFGGFVKAASKIKFENVIMPKIPDNLVPTNPVYGEFLKFLKSSKINVKKAKVGDVYDLGRGKLQILGPVKENYDNLNDFSVACRFDVGNSSFLLCGDAQKAAEIDLLKSGQNLKADVLKLNHHGSHTSNTNKFLKAVGAKVYVASVGLKNSYHHPSKKVLKRLANKKLYRTDLNGSVVFKVEDDLIKVECEK